MTGNGDVEMEDAEKLSHSSETNVQDSAKEKLEIKSEDGSGEGVNKEVDVASLTRMEEQTNPKGEDHQLVSDKDIISSENEELKRDLKEETAHISTEDEQNNGTIEVAEMNSANGGAQEKKPNHNGMKTLDPDKTVEEKLNEEVLEKGTHQIGGEDADCGRKILGSDTTVENADARETKQVSTILSANEAPPSESGAPRDVPQGENEDMEDAADPNLVKGEGKAKEEAKLTHVSPGTYDSFVNLETVAKHGSADASLPNQSEPVTPSSLSISTLMADDGDGTPEDQAAFMKELESYYRYRAMDFKPPKFYGQPLNCLKLWRAVIRLGGYDRVTGAKLWRQVGESFRPPKTCTTVSWTFRNFYEKSLLEYERHKIRCGELQFGTETLPETPGVDVEGNGFQGSVSGRARRDAAARAMQGWHSQRHFGYGEVAEPVIKDKNVINNAKREKNLKGIGAVSVLGKQKRPNEVEHSVKAIRTETSRQLVTSVIDIGPPAEWVKVNVLQAKDCFEVYALVPGLLREEVRVQSDPAGRLVITGQPEQVDNPWGVTAFKKVISLPTRIDPLRTSAVVSLHGGLFVHVPFEQSDS